MAVQLQSFTPKVVQESQVEQKQDTGEELKVAVDAYGYQNETVESLKAQLKEASLELSKARDQVVELAGVEDQSLESQVLEGHKHRIQIGASKQTASVVDEERESVKTLLGDAFDGLWSVSITALRKYLTPAQFEKVTSLAMTARTWKASRL